MRRLYIVLAGHLLQLGVEGVGVGVGAGAGVGAGVGAASESPHHTAHRSVGRGCLGQGWCGWAKNRPLADELCRKVLTWLHGFGYARAQTLCTQRGDELL